MIEDEVIIHFTGVGGKTCKSIIRCAKIEKRFIGVVKKYPIGDVVMNAHVKRDGAIEWIGVWRVGKIICITIFIAMSSSIQRTCLFPQSNETFAVLKFFVSSNLFPIPTCSESIILIDELAMVCIKTKSDGIFCNGEDQTRGF